MGDSVDLNTPPHSNATLEQGPGEETLETLDVCASETTTVSTIVPDNDGPGESLGSENVVEDEKEDLGSKTENGLEVFERCLFCHAQFKASQEDATVTSSSSINKGLHDIFILRTLLEIPYETVEKYLVYLGNQQRWINFCLNCRKVVGLAKEVYEELLKIQRKFKSLKKIIVDKVKKSELNSFERISEGRRRGRKRKIDSATVTSAILADECRHFVKQNKYPNFIDPFSEGDLRATKTLACGIRESLKSCSPSHDDSQRFQNKGEVTFLYLPNEEGKDESNDFETMSSHHLNESEGEHTDTEAFDLSSDDDDLEYADDDGDDDYEPNFVKRSRTKNSKTTPQRAQQKPRKFLAPSSNNSEAETNFVEYSIGAPSNQPEDDRKRGPYDKNIRFTCPYCEEFRFRMLKGEHFCEHLEGCEGLLQEEKKQKLLCCPVCQEYKRPLEERSQFVEHLPMCYGGGEGLPLNLRIFKCDICSDSGKKFFKLEAFLQHYAYHKKYKFLCALCPALLLNRKVGRNHFRQNHSESPGIFTVDTGVIENHCLPPVPWWCPVCPDSVFSEESLRNSHLQQNHPNYLKEHEPTHKCRYCENFYSTQDELDLHEGTEHVSLKALFQCDLCSETFHKEKFLHAHRTATHRVDLLVCDVCGLGCQNRVTLANHIQLHQQVRNHPCPQPGCEKSFTTGYFLKGHLFREHGDKEDPQKNPQLCPICKRVFHKVEYLKKHIRQFHEKKYDLTCHLCGKGLQATSHFKRHLAQHHGIGEYGKHRCPHEGCDRVFWYRERLKDHLTQHTGQPQFRCAHCGKGFYFKNQLQRHELIHINAESKPFQCEICAKRFPVRNYLYIHMKSHRKDQT